MKTYTDLSQLKKLKPAEPTVRRADASQTKTDKALDAASTTSEYFESLLRPDAPHNKPRAATPPRRATVVTSATISRVREQQAADALSAERAASEARIATLTEELEVQKAACASLAEDLAAMRSATEAELAEKDRIISERDGAIAERDAAIESKDREIAALQANAAAADCEIAHLKTLLDGAERTSPTASPLLDKPFPFSEKYPGELREHVVDTIVQAYRAAESAGRDRRARILEATLMANPPSGDLDMRRNAVKQILKNAGSSLDATTIAALERLGFRYVSGNKHHKLEWAGIRFPVSKTPGDSKSNLNTAAEILNRVF